MRGKEIKHLVKVYIERREGGSGREREGRKGERETKYQRELERGIKAVAL